MRIDAGAESGALAGALADATRRWDAEAGSKRLWARDATLFSNTDEARWLGWLELPKAGPDEAIGAPALRAAVEAHPARHVVVVGMGGSSLWPDVLGRTWNDRPLESGPRPRRRLHVLDTTVPDAIERFLGQFPLEDALYLIASKSGSTIEPNALYALIRARLSARIGDDAAARHFIAITDPGSSLEARARQERWLGIAPGRPDVGGRFSALSPFGLLPAFAMGLEPERLLASARAIALRCGPDVAVDANPGVRLGLALGTFAQQGRDKLTLSLSPAIASFGGWIEQLVAESTGKSGRGLLPITEESLRAPACYSNDRIFVDLSLAGDPGAADRGARLDALARSGHPVLRMQIADPFALGGSVFAWEIATAVVGAILGLNPFDQPDVEAAKQASRAILALQTGSAGPGAAHDADRPAVEAAGLALFAAPALTALTDPSDPSGQAGPSDQSAPPGRRAASNPADPAARATALLAAMLRSLAPGDAFLINAFLPDTPAIRARLEAIRERIGSAHPVATALSIGPRYLHSTGQLQKGGPSRLAGLQIWQAAGARRTQRLAIPELGGDFDGLAEAQAVGDFRVLAERGRRMLGVALGPLASPEPEAALETLEGWIRGALA